jgi:selenocysteine lyase/cysteine desulfurase
MPDALVCAGYKWLLGPYSLGMAWYGPRFDDGMPLEETWCARVGSEDFRRVADYRDEYRPAAARYDVGERSNFILVPMQLAALRRVLEWQPDRIQAYCGSIGASALREAVGLGVTLENEPWRGNHLFGLRLPEGMDPARLGPELERRRISVSLRGSAVRVAPHVYNGEDDLHALVEAIRATI